MLFRTGPRKELSVHDIEMVVDSPHVGQNLIDHPIMPHLFCLRDGYAFDRFIKHAGKEQDEAAIRYLLRKDGSFASSLLEMVAFPRVDHLLKNCKEYVAYKDRNGDKVHLV